MSNLQITAAVHRSAVAINRRVLMSQPINTPISPAVLHRAQLVANAAAGLQREGHEIEKLSLSLGRLDKPTITLVSSMALRGLIETGEAMNDACGTDNDGPWQRHHFDFQGCRVVFFNRGY